MVASTGEWTPRVPLVAAERRVDFPEINRHIWQRRRAVEKAATPAAKHLAYIVSEHSLPTNRAQADLEEALYTALVRTIDFGYRSVRSELDGEARVRGALSYTGIGDRGRVVLQGLPAVHALIRSRAKLVAANVADSARSAAHKQGIAPGSTALMVRTATTAQVLRTLHNGVLETVSEALNLGRAAAAQDILQERGSGVSEVVLAADRVVPEFCMRSEQLDKDTCDPCGTLHGEIYQVGTSEYYANMPPSSCLGGGRCRGVFVYGAGSEFAPPTESAQNPSGPRTVADFVPGSASQEWEGFRLDRMRNRDARLPGYAERAGEDVTAAQLQEAVADRLRELANEANVMIRATPESLDGILADQRFKSQFETGTSGGPFAPDTRAFAEEKLFGYGTDLAPELRPIYGYMEGADESRWLKMYGDVRIQLKKEVKARTTFTSEDSLGLNVMPVAIEGSTTEEWSLAYDWFMQPGRTGYGTSLEDIRAATIRDLSGAYPEAQIHGGLLVSDIEEVILPEWVIPSYWQRQLEQANTLEKLLREHGKDDISAGLAEVERLRAEAEAHLVDPYLDAMRRLDELGIRWHREARIESSLD